VNDNTVYLTGEKGFDSEFMFAVQGDALVYNAAGSDAFPYPYTNYTDYTPYTRYTINLGNSTEN